MFPHIGGPKKRTCSTKKSMTKSLTKLIIARCSSLKIKPNSPIRAHTLRL